MYEDNVSFGDAYKEYKNYEYIYIHVHFALTYVLGRFM